MEKRTFRVIVKGLVQGVGFRPFIYRTASALNLKGRVRNTNDQVRIEINCTVEELDNLKQQIRSSKPSAAFIEEIISEEIPGLSFSGFTIEPSENISEDITEISPDIAVCSDCLEDMDRPGNRHDYAFVNCTNCGPRFTIIEDLPYDRGGTTMKSFGMCRSCKNEYHDIHDRRFHAQPVACSECGPHYELYVKGKLLNTDSDQITTSVASCLDNEGIVLLKGLGGMHLACNPFSRNAVLKLRDMKRRDGKPLAMMFGTIEDVRRYALISPPEEAELTSWRRPIVLLDRRTEKAEPEIPEELYSGLNRLGIMLPYMPFHYLLFRKLKSAAIVLTSGNFSSEPIIISNSSALGQFSEITDAVVLHNRDICNRTDDSVIRVTNGKAHLVRRSRGFVPEPVRTNLDMDGIVGMGAELTNCFGAGKGKKIYLSQYIGDLQAVETASFYEQNLDQFLKLMRVTPSLIAVDMHPDYISTRSASRFNGVPVVRVQHHHAHIAACMTENGLDEKVIGVAFDGTGFGTDGNIWGSEFLICGLDGFTRESHFDYIPLPGGDSAIEEPWRIAVSWLYKTYGLKFLELDIPTIRSIPGDKIELLIKMIDRKINSPLSSGAGRLFDAVASISGIVQTSTFQAEGPMRLEALTDKSITASYDYESGEIIKLDETIKQIVSDVLKGESEVTIATKLHNTILLIIFDTVSSLRRLSGLNKVILSGGVFQNGYLLSNVTGRLTKAGFEVFSHAAVPSNDGGIAVGQMAVASKLKELKCV